MTEIFFMRNFINENSENKEISLSEPRKFTSLLGMIISIGVLSIQIYF